MRYFFETYGCQMNVAESTSIERMFLSRSWECAESANESDAVIINTCSVRATAENRIFGRLGFYNALKKTREKNGKALALIVTGCMAERLLIQLQKEFPFIDYVVGTFQKQKFGEIISAIEKNEHYDLLIEQNEYEFAPLSFQSGTFSSYVPIMHGCNNFCTYCIVPYVRGREVSRDVKSILDELDSLSNFGVKEITLLGQNVNSYKSENVNFASLLNLMQEHLEKTNSPIEWIRFLSSHPKDLSDEVISAVKNSSRICHRIHLPLQHASNKILESMNRRYTRETYFALVEKMKNEISDLTLSTDIMTGFPNETDEDFETLLDFIKCVRFSTAYMYYFNPRDGTKAATMQNQIPLALKKKRLQKIIDTQLLITSEELLKRVGRVEKVLVESESRDDKNEMLGKTSHDERVAFASDKSAIGKFVEVRFTGVSGQTLKGEINV